MKSEMVTWAMISVAFVFGLIGASSLAGCQKDGTNYVAVETSEPVMIGEPDMTAPKEPTVEEPAVKEPAPKELTAKEPAVEEPAPKEPAVEEPAEKANSTDQKSPVDKSANAQLKAGDWAQLGGTSYRNNTPIGSNIATTWEVGGFDRKTNEWIPDDAVNIKWVSRVGSDTYGNLAVSDGQIYVGTNNGSGYLDRYPAEIDLGCLLCFDEETGKFLWQHSSEKLPTGREHDWPLVGICSTPYVEGDRLWFVTSRGEVRCLDTKGYNDGEDDGEVKAGWGRLFDVTDAPAGLAVVSSMELTEVVREKFKASGVELPAKVKLVKDASGEQYTFAANDREYQIRVDGKPDAPTKLSFFRKLSVEDKTEADVVWVFDMMKELDVWPHNMSSCSVTAFGDILFVSTSNGVNETHIELPSPKAPSFIAMDKNSGEIYWTDASPGANILHGQWSSPAVAELGGVPQVIFPGGDGWVYSFRADKGVDGKPELLWKFDVNPKESKWGSGGRGTRNNIIATPVISDGLVYIAAGQDPEHGEGIGHLWCLNPLKRGDVSSQLAVKKSDPSKPIPHKRLQAVVPAAGEIAIDNPNSAAVWHYSEFDQTGDGEITFEEEMHRSCGAVAVKGDVLFISDFAGLFHCLNAKTGEVYWTYDMLAAAWGAPLIVDNHVYMIDEYGDVSIFPWRTPEELAKLAAEGRELNRKLNAEEARLEKEEDEAKQEVIEAAISKIEDALEALKERLAPKAEIAMGNLVFSSPVVANNVLYIVNKTHLFAITPSADSKGADSKDAE
jgi:outer membrane protein assembly factor BamB